MRFRDGKSRVIHHTIVRISSTSMIKKLQLIFGSMVWVLTRFVVGMVTSVTLGLILREEDAKFFELFEDS